MPATTLDHIHHALVTLAKENKQLSMTAAALFVSIAINPGRSLVEYSYRLNILSSTASRMALDLSKQHRSGRPGLDLIKWEIDDESLRKKRYYLTARGQRIIQQILEFQPKEGASNG